MRLYNMLMNTWQNGAPFDTLYTTHKIVQGSYIVESLFIKLINDKD